jgi:hypothetical protein
LAVIYVQFLLIFLYVPEKINITEAQSRGCSGGQFNETIQENAETFRSVNFTDEIIAAFPNLLTVVEEGSSYAEFQLYRGANHPNPQRPLGRISDEPRTDLVPMLGFPTTLILYTRFSLSR